MWWKKYIKIAIIVIMIGLVGFGIYKLAGVIVDNTYSSRELVEEQTPEKENQEQIGEEISEEVSEDNFSDNTLSSSSTPENTNNDNVGKEETESNIQQGTKQESQSNQDFILSQTKSMLKDSPYPELAEKKNTNYTISVDENGDYTVSIEEYTFGFYKDSLAFRYLSKSGEFTEEEINWLSPNGETQWFTEENGKHVFR